MRYLKKIELRKKISLSRLTIRERGFTLVITLVMLIVILLLSCSLAYLALQSERAARSGSDRLIALAAAEAALRDAERDIDPEVTGERSAIFDASSNLYFEEGCAKGDGNIYQGLCLPSASGRPPIWLSVDLAANSSDSASVQYGRFTGQKMETGRGVFTSKLPRYLIEIIPDIEPGQRADMRSKFLFRITAIGFGSNPSTQVVLQSIYRKVATSL